MNDTLKKVATAISDADFVLSVKRARGEDTGDEYEALALAAIEAMRVPTTEQKRGLLVHRGYDPDAKEETLDGLGKLDLMTMGTYISAYTAMVDAAAKTHQ